MRPRGNRRVPHTPDFLCSFLDSLNFLRLSLKKGAHAVPSRSCVQEIWGMSLVFRVGYRVPSPKACRGRHRSVRVPLDKVEGFVKGRDVLSGE